jgi:type VI secretion system protein ImpA
MTDAAAPEDSSNIALAWLLEPISDDAPCGPSAEDAPEIGVEAYLRASQMRLPTQYFTHDGLEGVNIPFDTTTIDIAAERQQAFEVLRQSRDLRVLMVLSRFEALCGELEGYVNGIEAIAALLEKHPYSVHPVSGDDWGPLRKILAGLANRPTVLIPLELMPLNGVEGLTGRNFRAAQKGDHPDNMNEDGFLRLLAQPNGEQKRRSTHALLQRVLVAVDTLKAQFLELSAYTADKELGVLESCCGELVAIIEAADPDVSPPADEALSDRDASAPGNDASAETGVAALATNSSSTAIRTRAEAQRALMAVEVYLAKTEPSSISLLLIAQARMLIGQSLVKAMSTLAPQQSGNAVLRFEDDLPFQLNWDQMKRLTDEAVPDAGRAPKADDDLDETPFPEVTTRDEIAPHLRGVESHFRRTEISSPIPILLSKARSLLTKDFTEVFTELTTRKT